MPGCVKSTQSSIEISWNVLSNREYSYKVEGGERTFGEFKLMIPEFSHENSTWMICPIAHFILYLAGKKLGSMESDDFQVEGDRGTLTITSSTEWTVAIYKVTVSDLTSSVPTVETKQFEIRKGMWYFG